MHRFWRQARHRYFSHPGDRPHTLNKITSADQSMQGANGCVPGVRYLAAWIQMWRYQWQRLGKRSLRFLALLSLALWCSVALSTLMVGFPLASSAGAQAPVSQSSVNQSWVSQAQTAADLETQARARYGAGAFAEAADLFAQAAAATNDPLQVGMLLANASLAYQQLGNWALAEETIQAARALVVPLRGETLEALAIFAQVENIGAQLLFSQGQAEVAAENWEVVAIAYERTGDLLQARQAQFSQAQALQAAGFYRLSVELLVELTSHLAEQPPSELAVRASRSLGEAFRLTGKLSEAEVQLQRSLQLAQELSLPDQVSIAYRSLGDLALLQESQDSLQVTPLQYYDRAVAAAATPLVQFQARLAQLRRRIDLGFWQSAYQQGLTLWQQVETLPPGRASLYSQIELVQQLQIMRQAITLALSDGDAVPDTVWYTFVRQVFAAHFNTLRSKTTNTYSRSLSENPLWYVIDKQFPPLTAMATLLGDLRQVAQNLGDVQAEATLLGVLGSLYEQVEDWDTASQVTQTGLVLAQSYNLEQVAYHLQAQLGRIQLAQGDRTAAIDAYRASVQTLQAMRADVVAVSSEAQYSFQRSIEPIYRELATLLLEEQTETNSADNLKQAREVIELLQLAELDNFFREACLNAETVGIDDLDKQAAVVYPILLSNRLDIVVSLPNEEFRHFPVEVDQADLNQTLQMLRQALETPRSDAVTRAGIALELVDAPQLQVLPPATKLYNWLIAPAEAALTAADIKTLVFVLDGSLRSIPMAALYDGSQFLIEKYEIALTPGLQLLDPKPLPKQDLSVIVAGLSETGESPDAGEFGALPNVVEEVRTIEQFFPSVVLLNQDFNVDNFVTQVGTLSSPVVHLATHGQFGSNLDDTFVLTWDDRLVANRFSNILLTSELSREAPIELLVLSACETATGDDRAVLGLAGIAMRSGARSTLASLWQVSDPATAQLMGEFYRQLSDAQITKATAIRQAQLELLKDEQYRHPYYWAPFVLVGNWL